MESHLVAAVTLVAAAAISALSVIISRKTRLGGCGGSYGDLVLGSGGSWAGGMILLSLDRRLSPGLLRRIACCNVKCRKT